MIVQNELNAEEIRMTMQEIAQEHLPFEADGYKCTSEMIYDVLMKAAADGISIDAACRDLEQSVTGNTLREVLNEQLRIEHLREHEAEVNAALAARIPKQMRSFALEAAIDEHDEPFYGQTSQLRHYTVRSRARKGTTHFFRIVSAYVIYRQMRLTLAVTFVLPQEKTVAVVSRLHQRLCRGRKSYRTTYTFSDSTTVQMAVVATFVPNKTQKRRRKWLLFVLLGLDWTPQKIYQRYRFRFGIESTYRILRRVRIKTTSRNPAFRFFVLGFALLLVNLWAFLRWFVARVPGPGPHRLDPLRFQFQAFVSLLRRAIEHALGSVMSVPCSAPIPEIVNY